jgi:uncharacterized protein YodC (DUF2158 family)
MANITVEFEVGDVVSLISGGPEMTISKIDEDKGLITATWFERVYPPGAPGVYVVYGGLPCVAEFDPDTLTYESD